MPPIIKRSGNLVVTILIIVAITSVSLSLPAFGDGTTVTQTGNSFAIRNVRVFNGWNVVPHANVVVRNGVIKAVGPDVSIPHGLAVYDGANKTLLPGLIDAHVHTDGHSQVDALRFGITTELDMFTDWHLLAAAKKHRRSMARTDKADMWSAGTLATAPHGHGAEYGQPIATLTSPKQAQPWVDARIKEGSDYIKIILDDGSLYGRKIPTLSPPIVKALIDAAHRRGKMAVIHLMKLADARMAVGAGVDGLAHIFADRPADAAFIALIKRKGTFVVPTLSLFSTIACGPAAANILADPSIKPFLAPEQTGTLNARFPGCTRTALKTAMRNVDLLHAAGIPILAGTDAGNPGTAHGASLHGELKLLVDAGLSPIEALRAATSLPAKYFHLTDRGRIAPSLRADLLLVRGDPTEHIVATRAIADIWKNGYHVTREVAKARTAVQPAPAAPDESLISDFENGKVESAYGLGWQATSDSFVGGHSLGTIKVIQGGANGSHSALQMSGAVKSGFATPLAGVIFFPGKTPMTPMDFSAKHALSFWARGDGGTFSVMMFSGARHVGKPSILHFTAGKTWQKVTLPLKHFKGADITHLRGIAFTAGPELGKFQFAIDAVTIN